MPRILLAALAALLTASAGAQTYRWIDQDGKVNYTDTPPPASAKSVQKRSAGGNVVETNQVPYATQQAVRSAPVTIYTSENCKEACNDARALLQTRGVPFREVSVSDEKSRDELKKVSGGDEVPVMTVGKSMTKGFGADSWHLALDAAGYPRSGPPLPAQAQKPAAPAAKAEAPKEAQADQSAQQKGRYAPVPEPSSAEASAPPKGRYAPQ